MKLPSNSLSFSNEVEIADSVKSARILVVDDMALMRKMIGMCLTRGGFENVHYADDGDDALVKVEKNPPDLIILDLNMPRVSGYDVCRSLRAEKRYVGLPILVQSASETPEERVEVFRSGATDFVSKPINQPELLARVKMHLENRFLIHSLTSFRERMKSELVLARDMQQSLLPETMTINDLEEKTKVKIEHYYQASFELGGDLWGCWALPGNRIGVFILDIAGHGVGAALNTFRVHAVMGRFKWSLQDPALFLADLNRILAPHFPLGQFATMFYFTLDYKTGDMVYAGAGAPRPMIIGEDGVRLLDSTGIPVGIVKEPGYENHHDKLGEDESIFCYSDVLLEALQPDGSFLGEEGLVEWVEKIAESGDRSSLVSKLLWRFFDSQPNSLSDDLTAVAIHRGAREEE